MEAKLTFLFPPTSSSNKHNTVAYNSYVNLVQMTLVVPFAKQQPHLVSNLFYLLMNELPSDELLAALGVERKEISFANAEEVRVRNNLKSFKEMCIVRIDVKEGVVELGSSSSKSIFGGFINDEKLPDVESTNKSTAYTTGNTSNNNDDDDDVANIGRQMRLLRAGTLLCGNIGIVNSNGSRYYLLLRDFNVKRKDNGNNVNNKNNNNKQKDDDDDDNDSNPFSSCIPLGFVTSGLKMFSEAVAQVPVQPRVLLPLKKVELVESEIDFTQNFTQSSISSNNNSNTMQPVKTSETNAHPSVDKRSKHTKRTRSDEDENQTEQYRNEENPINAKTNLSSKSTNEFFHFSARFPTKHLSQLSGVLEQQRKRRRLDASAEVGINSVTGGNGSIDTTILHNMAVLPPMSSEVASAKAIATSMARLARDESNEQSNKFDYFKVQSNVLINDLMQIEQTQGQRQRRHAKRNAKQSRMAAAKHDTNKRSGDANMTSSRATSDLAKVITGKKLLKKRY